MTSLSGPKNGSSCSWGAIGSLPVITSASSPAARQGVMGLVACAEFRLNGLAARQAFEREQLQRDVRADQPPELLLRLQEGGIRHVVEQADLQPGRRLAELRQVQRRGTARHRVALLPGQSLMRIGFGFLGPALRRPGRAAWRWRAPGRDRR